MAKKCDDPDKLKEIGKVRFFYIQNMLGIHQLWNPRLMSKECREKVAGELEKAAARMRNDEFEQNGEWKKYPVPEEATS